MVIALIVSEAIVFVFMFDLFIIIGIEPVVPYVGIALTGFALSRGANFVWDLIGNKSKETTIDG